MRLTKFLKRQVSKVLCAALVLSSVAVAGERQVAEAASKTEIETNGTMLTLNEAATGVLEKEDEQDWYIFNIKERGYFTIDLKRNDSTDTDKIRDGWKCSLYHEDDLVNPVTSASSIINSYEGKELPLPEGRYYICVEGTSHSSYYAPVESPYDVTVNFTETEEWEHEYNDTNAVPNSIEANKTYLGNLHKSDDVDWYKVSTPENGTMQLEFGPDVSTNVDDIKDGWKITILDKELNSIRTYDTKTKLTPQILPFEDGIFYIRVEGVSSSDFYSPINCIYNLQLKITSSSDWEAEYNNEYVTANSVISDDEYHGVLSWADDEDWYLIDNKTDVTAALKFRVDDSVSVDDIKDGWKIVVYNAEREVIKELDSIKKTTIEENIELPTGASYIKISGQSSSDFYSPVDCIYHLTVTTTPVQAPDINPEPSGTPDTTGKPDNITKPNTTSKPNNTAKPDSTSKPNNTAKPITTSRPNSTNNKAIQKAITTSKVTTSTVTSKKKKSVYLRWKKQKYAGGYEIYRSPKKKSGYKKVKTIKGGSKVSWTDKKVKGGKTYYYKIRAFRKINGKKSVSGFSKVKRVKVKK